MGENVDNAETSIESATEAIDFIKDHESEINNATEEVVNENRILINKILGYVEGAETKLLAFDLKVGDYLEKVSKPGNITRPITTAALLYALATGSRACATLPSSPFVVVPEGQPAATDVIPIETSEPTKYVTPTVSPEQIEREEILERLKTRDFGWIDEEIKDVTVVWDGEIQKVVDTSIRENLYKGYPFVYTVFTSKGDFVFASYSPYDFPATSEIKNFRLGGFDDENIAHFLTAVTFEHITEGWDGDIDTIVFMNKNEDGKTCFWPKNAYGIGYILNPDGSYTQIDFNNPSNARSLTNDEVKAFDGYLMISKNKDGSVTSFCNYEDDLASGFKNNIAPTQEATSTAEDMK